ncbi:FAD-binding and (Fe-S)-binding domain-containing protein [Yinghuangia seranimata]|uniref:FAD-binding and (Fe-S)-binding domain-containing protein n=1 Tax=Yinghuangia seranimata TaxID=408067 RepID=UPI00248D2704|nr:FAD-binding and (Fe-S)-binding domain-containing protein [Yinghuangia seranimata]MDI2131255.1 FAD-binding and (Fe-S)-binding domain-containing protein [Yinghuangia seranimata]
MYSMDASNYRHVPPGVVTPRDVDDLVAAVAVCHEFGAAMTPRGGGTSIGGQATGTGVVLDLARHLTRIESVDPDARVAVVEPGVVLDDLRAAAAPYGLTFGPDPSTHSRCTIGGMIGNDACGSHSVAWGRTSANVAWLDVLTPDGVRLRVGSGAEAFAGAGPHGVRAEIGSEIGTDRIRQDLHALADDHLALIRRGYPDLPRRVSGYALDRLLPEHGRDLARALVGSEGTCAVVLRAGVRLVATPRARVLAVLGFADDVASAEAAPAVLPFGPLTVESLSAELASLASSARGVRLPDGGAWLFVEVGGDSADEAAERAHAMASGLGLARSAYLVVREPAEQRALWRIREEASGTATRLSDGSEAWPGWEDTAVRPELLGGYLRELKALMGRFGLRGLPYGHFGEGCVHIRFDFDLMGAEGTARFREFSGELADLVVAHGGSLSGEHGDGQARAEFLPRMYGSELVDLFGRFKQVWDPRGLLNPGMLVRPRPVDADLRFTGLPRTPVPVAFGYPHDGGDFAAAVRRCVGVGKCRESSATSGGGVMCPSFRATGEEKDSTRGRARLLHEMLIGDVVRDGWGSEEVRDALDLCLGCKGCRSDCPVGVDVATYKAEFLHQHYKDRSRPRGHYVLGGLPWWARAIDAVPGAAGVLGTASRWERATRVGLRAAGLDASRELPRFAPQSFTRSWRARRPVAERLADVRRGGDGKTVVLLPDTFTNHFTPSAAWAAVRVLEDAGLRVLVPPKPVCCGLTWVSTGQLDTARRVMRGTMDVLRPALDAGLPVVGLEPSCTAALRTDVPELLGAEAAGLADAVSTFAETLEDLAPDWSPPRIDREVTGQTHCHQHAVLGDDADRRLRAKAGLTGPLAGGCCGLAGNFGYEPGHGEISRTIADERLLPALAAAPDAEVLADGFSCRTQIDQLAGRRARHLAELLAEGLGGDG